MQPGAFFAGIDIALLLFWGFLIFFAGLIWYLRQEDRREGYPLANAATGEVGNTGWLFVPEPKTFRLHGGQTVQAPNGLRDDRPVAAYPTARFPGAPLEPTGDAMKDAVGPGAYAERADTPDMTHAGKVKIVPMRNAPGYSIEPNDLDPRGMKVVGCDRKVGGTVVDVWVDQAEHLARYLEVAVGSGASARNVLLPIPFTVFKTQPDRIYVHAITGAQFAGVPGVKTPGQVTFLEEDRIAAYYGGGQLYATADRAEPIL